MGGNGAEQYGLETTISYIDETFRIPMILTMTCGTCFRKSSRASFIPLANSAAVPVRAPSFVGSVRFGEKQ